MGIFKYSSLPTAGENADMSRPSWELAPCIKGAPTPEAAVFSKTQFGADQNGK